MQLSLPHSLSSNNDCEPPTQFMISPDFLPSFLSTVWTIDFLELNVCMANCSVHNKLSIMKPSCKLLKVRCLNFLDLFKPIFFKSLNFKLILIFWVLLEPSQSLKFCIELNQVGPNKVWYWIKFVFKK